MKKLVIAEKPSVARDLVKVLGKFQAKEDCFENEDYVVSWAVGHLVELSMPEDIDAQYKRWTLESLPIIPEKFSLQVIEASKKRFGELKKLLHRRDIDGLINACDAGREGELIFSYICELAGNKKPFQRLWLSSMTPESIRTAFAHLRSSEEMQALQAAARCRSEADWIVGINGTRALTLRIAGRGSRRVVSVGRVQTPTLAMIVAREREIRNFQPRDYWRIVGQFQIHNGNYEGVFQRKDFRKNPNDPHDRVERLWDFSAVEALLADLRAHSEEVRIEEKKKRSSQGAPRLYDLTLLQREANARFHLPAGMTLKIAQSLYEKHKCTTYPRTDSQVLPEDYVATCRELLSSLSGDYAPLAQKILEQHGVDGKNRKIFNDKGVRDHFAIIPTGKQPTGLSESEEKIYEMVVRRFLAVFFPAAEFDVTTRLSFVGPHGFKTEGKVLVKAGWLEVYGREVGKEADETLVALHERDGQPPSGKLVEVQAVPEATKPPARYNEATLLAMMEGAGKAVEDEELAEAMKERGLGTPATRAQIIEHLIDYQYMEREQKDLIPTAKAEDLLCFLERVQVGTITSPAMTGEWEFRLRQVENRQLPPEHFRQGIADMTRQMITSIRQFQESESDASPSELLSPSDQKPLLEMLRCYRSQDGLLTLYKTVAGRRMTLEEYRQLLQDRKTPLLEKFHSKAGRPFNAYLVLDEDWHVRFVFEENRKKEDSPGIPSLQELENYPVIGACPFHKEGNRVFETENHYLCEQTFAEKKPACRFRIGKEMLGVPLTPEHIQQLLQKKKTELIEGFVSRRTGKPFAATLALKSDGGLRFVFPPRTRAVAKSSPAEEAP
ncbi:MAG: DNA topoisomerase 3 [Puniceicoccales bacterium]|jgi:DNA topoisomerase-3|nr:DNA topoisomerase 3 [Puniceicoccales bacterium]